jgi:membrane associated rhomboid family serine protease
MEACYRHPDRETGVACSNCERPICPDCMTTTPVGMRCPECAKQTTKVRTAATSDDPVATYVLIGINVVVALGGLFAGSESGFLYDEGELSRGALAQGDYWRLVTSGFLHAPFNSGGLGPMHLLFNMLSLWILGGMLEPAIGRARFVLVYFVSLLAGGFGALLLQPDQSVVGASGAVFGLMGAAVVAFRRRGIPLMESGLGLWIGLNLLLTFRPGISIGGHLGGLAAGVLAALILLELGDRMGARSRVPLVVAAFVGVIAVAGAIVIS